MAERTASARKKSIFTETKIDPQSNLLQYKEGGKEEKIDLTLSHYHTAFETDCEYGIEINLAQPFFLPNSKKLFFPSKRERNRLVELLEQNKKNQSVVSYTNTQVPRFQMQEYESFCANLGQDKLQNRPSIRRNAGSFRGKDKLDEYVETQSVFSYLKKYGIQKLDPNEFSKVCNFSGWQKLYNKIMDSTRSELLQEVFNRYSSSHDDELWMTADHLHDFLVCHQDEEPLDRKHLLELMQDHMDQVRRRKKHHLIL